MNENTLYVFSKPYIVPVLRKGTLKDVAALLQGYCLHSQQLSPKIAKKNVLVEYLLMNCGRFLLDAELLS